MSGILGLGAYEGRPELAQDVIASEATGCLIYERALRFAAEVKAARPDMTIFGRDYLSVDDQVAFVSSPNPYQAGYQWALRLCQQYPAVDVWQCLNEMLDPVDKDDAPDVAKRKWGIFAAQVTTELGFVDGCAEMGRRACVINCAYGTYPVDDPGDSRRYNWPKFLSVVRPLLEHKARPILGLHAYGKGERDRMSIEPEWYALRHRKLMDSLKRAGVPVPETAITEYGHAIGWRPWLSAEDCAADFRWFGTEILKDPYVRWAFAFSDGDSGGFGNFDLYGTGVLGEMIAFNRLHPVTAEIPKPKEGESMPIKLPQIGNEWDASPNCEERPEPKRIEGIVIHSMEGAFDVARAIFKNPDQNQPGGPRSAHYLLRKDGYLLQMVEEGKKAWHAGLPLGDKRRTGVWGMNTDFNGISVGIELEGFAGQPFTDQQYDILRKLVWHLIETYKIPFDRQHIVAHSELSKVKGDPGSQFRWDFLMGQQPKPPNVDWQAEATKLKTENARLHSIIDAARGILTV